MTYYKDFREYLKTLEDNSRLWRIKRRIVKETELMPLVRLEFKGLPEDQRRGFLFENVVGVKGEKYETNVAVGVLGSSLPIYLLALQCKDVQEVRKKWERTTLNPVEPSILSSGPCQEVTYEGSELERDGKGLEVIPWIISLPGFGSDPRTSATHVVTRDPDTGVLNVGNYQAVIRSKKCLTLNIVKEQHGFIHWRKYRSSRKPMPAAICVGVVPAVAYASFSRVPYGVNEYAAAGGLAGESIELVRCKTVDVEVPASAEIVIEGQIRTDVMEPATPFGEFTGYMALGEMNFVMDVTCVTTRKNPIFNAILSEAPPSEAISARIGDERSWYNFLRFQCNFPNVIDVTSYMLGGSGQFLIVRMKKNHPSDPMRALYAAQAYRAGRGKVIIAVDEDINPKDPEAVIWALASRMMPHRDVKVVTGRASHDYDYSAFPPGTPVGKRSYPSEEGASALLIDATMKWPYPPVALPDKKHMEKALEIWKELDLPKLQLSEPWHGYKLGLWSNEDEEFAQMAIKGEFYKIGEILRGKRVSVEELGLG